MSTMQEEWGPKIMAAILEMQREQRETFNGLSSSIAQLERGLMELGEATGNADEKGAEILTRLKEMEISIGRLAAAPQPY
ncbi:unnamed protein product, partial [Phaeothamnion confervicola]